MRHAWIRLYELGDCVQLNCRAGECSALAWWTGYFGICWLMLRGIRIERNSVLISYIRRKGPDRVWGLLELRAFEMAPHVRMSLSGICCLIQGAWLRCSGSGRTKRGWCAGAHRAARPLHACRTIVNARPFSTCLTDFECGLAMNSRRQWFRSSHRLSFPPDWVHYRARTFELELRQALEPWHVLGEEAEFWPQQSVA